MRNVTITLDDETARWARIEAAKLGTSVSRLVGGMLTEHMKSAATYERARRSYSNRSPTALKAGDGSYPARSEIHSR
ncbi:MAG: hypothetical protein OXN80_09440 [bacterium]|nr:hypothetical protein [bacterium]MDE0189309.1 hypothetical protein [bacterium]MDE0502139.1 hypothetical protein [bacterium]